MHGQGGHRRLLDVAANLCGPAAFADAGVTPSDVDLGMIYDSYTITVLTTLEGLGFCKPGEGGAFVQGGSLKLGGRLPINTHGGMLSHADAGAAGGLFGIVEAVRQLRGGLGERQVRDAKLALVHNEGGILSAHCTTIFSGERS